MEKSDGVLIQETLAGELRAFDAIMARYERLVFKVALTYSSNADSAADITQIVFLKAFQNLAALRGEEKLKGWLVRIGYNESMNWLRKHRHQGKEEEIDAFDFLPDGAISQEEALLRKERGQFLLRRLRRLNPKHRLAVTLRYFEGMPIAEIARCLRCSEPLVKNILFRSLQRMKQGLPAPSRSNV